MTQLKLVVAEKPSVAATIAKVLGVKNRKDGYIEGNDYIVTWCIGHLVALSMPDAYGQEYKDWKKLPIIPDNWKYNILPGTKKQFEVIKKLMHRSDVESVVCATDAGREGELIFRLVYNEAKCTKPIERLWISSLEDISIKQGFQNLRSGKDYEYLYQSALCRERADWLVGINASRYFTVKNNRTLSIGRVQTPTLNMIVERDTAINTFTKGYYYTVDIECSEFTASSDKFEDKNEAKNLAQSISVAKIISVKKEKKFTAPPKLYDLTTLQRESNKHFGFTAQQTLDVVQKLYEAKLVTYPRTDSRYLTEDMEGTALDVILNIKDTFDFETVDRPDIKPVMNNKYVTDHHAIIPTENLNKTALLGLKENDKKVLTLISLRLLTATAPKEEYELTKIVAECENNKFTATNKKIINHGFKAVEKQYLSSEEKDNAEFGNISENSDYKVTSKVTEHETQPPKAYTEDTLLSAMEKAGKKDFSEDVERVGLGTPATRAGIIETLIKRGYIERKSKNLIPTALGKEVISSVPDKLKSSEMTVEWENELSQIAKGNSDSSGFMKQVEEFVRDIVKE